MKLWFKSLNKFEVLNKFCNVNMCFSYILFKKSHACFHFSSLSNRMS